MNMRYFIHFESFNNYEYDPKLQTAVKKFYRIIDF